MDAAHPSGKLRRPSRRLIMGAILLVGGLGAGFLTGRVEELDLPERATKIISPRQALRAGGGYGTWPTLGNRRGEVDHAQEGMRAWLTSFDDRRNWIGGADPIEFQDLRSLSGSVVFSGMIPNSGHIRADRAPGTGSSEPVSIVQLESPELSLMVYNPGYRGPGGAGSGATSGLAP